MKKTILIAAVMIFAFSVAASAQALFDVGSTPVTTVASCGKTEMTGDIVFSTVISSLPIITGTIQINYGVPVSSTVGAVVEVTTGITPATPLGNPLFVLPAGSLITSGNILTILINPGAGWPNGVAIRVRGVKVDVSASPNLASVVATISGTNNTFVAGETSVTVISSTASALLLTLGSTPILNISSVFPTTPAPPGNPVVTATEGFLGAWIQNSAIRFNFTALPAGLTLTFPANIPTSAGNVFAQVNSDLAFPPATTPTATFGSAAGAFSVYYRLVNYVVGSDTVRETLALNPVLTVLATPRPLGLGTVTATAEMAAGAAGYVPNYLAGGCITGSATVLSVVPASTTLLIPYATAGGAYNTGIAIANTTTDPLAAGNTAKVQSGTLTFYFYPQTGTAFQWPLAGGTLATGAGLTSGALNSGGLYTVLLSELLTAAGKPASFSGYIIAVANFTDAHGQYFISDFAAFTNGALMLVIDPGGRNNPIGEMLNN
jgi:hypothetical protein